MCADDQPKPLFWIGPTKRVLKSFPAEVRRQMGFGFYQAQEGGKHIDAKPLKGFGGSGVLEIVEDFQGNAFRGVYTIRFKAAVYVLHVFQKKSKRGIATPKFEMDLIRKRLKIAEEHYAEWRAEQKGKNEEESGGEGGGF